MQYYEITHDTTYRYASPVMLSQQIARLCPRTLPRQQLLAHRLEISPAPSAPPSAKTPTSC